MASLLVARVPAVPLRAVPQDAAEMVSQLLCGESVELLTAGAKDWVRVRGLHDDYEGWCDRKQLAEVTSCGLVRVLCRYTSVATQSGMRVLLSPGSLLHLDTDGRHHIGQEVVTWDAESATPQPEASRVETARQWLGVPYLWGGRTEWGVDCSGYVQVLLALEGVALPRDASDQFAVGSPVGWETRAAGDLAFFENDSGRIVHVGLLSTPSTILHAAGEVREDELKPEGIWRAQDAVLTHRLAGLRRF